MEGLDTLLLGSAPPRLAELLRRAPWMDGNGRAARRFDVLDQAALGEFRLLLVAPVGGEPSRWFVPVADHGRGPEAAGAADYDRAVVRALAEGLRLPTARGGRIEFHGAPADFRGQLPFDPGWSSNSLTLVDLGGAAHAHKTYRRLDTGNREPELLRLMAPGGRTQRLVGDYGYREPGTGRLEPLGVVYAYAAGDGLDVPLRDSLRGLWQPVADGLAPERAVAAARQRLAEPLRGAGRFLRDFHRELAQRLGPAPEFPAEGYHAGTAARTAELRPRILADDRFPVAVRRAALAALDREAALVRELPLAPPPSGPSHGDLHLSHFLRRETPGGWEMCVIDLSTPVLDPDDPTSAQSPWQDLVGLLRGLECFTADELAHQAAIVLDLDSDETCRTALLCAAGAPPDTPGWTPERLAALERLRGTAQLWSAAVAGLLLDGYTAAGREGGGVELAGHPAWRMFRLRRLVHELAYAYAHDRAYHAAINLRHAVEA
ncbi:hypothetical protein [Streptacidiphilus sp. P02-A3a]|uniref:hypothetical protein n=1 Tax=Streptacidiphilus sp. P02-A3a TaxID=2704468 RepID=UPI0015FA02BD|nr:hypothetical protein [Streptacidiphilus sp. P02-A3a]QMU71263.1 hypothetical protein GXP74_26600 [Streptacidiphilus sp. P02-A3a]